MWTCGFYVVFVIISGVSRVRCECIKIPTIDKSSNNATGIAPYPTGTVVQFTCYRGYRPYGSVHFVCRDGGFMGDLKCAPIYCSQIDIVYGSVSNVPSYEAGSTVTFTCDKGYRMEGEATMLCQEDGQWNPINPPKCIPKNCGEFGIIVNGTVFQDIANGVTNSFGSTVKVTCNAGYILQGNKCVTCDADGTWSTRPKCERSRCPRHPALDTNCLDKSVVSSSRLYLKCKEGVPVTSVGSLTAQCTDRDLWTDLDTGCFCHCKINSSKFADVVDIDAMHNKSHLPHGEGLSWNCPFCRVKSSKGDIVCHDGAFSDSDPYCKADPVCIVLFVIAAFIVLIAMVTIMCFCWRKKMWCFEDDDDDSDDDKDKEEMTNMMTKTNEQNKKSTYANV